MTNGRLFLAGVAGIAALALTGVAGVLWLGSGGAAAPPGARTPPPAPKRTAVVPVTVATPRPPAPGPSAELEAAVSPVRRRPSADAGTSWDRVPVAARPYDLGPELARPVASALAAARDQMDPCFEEEDRLLAAGQGPRFDPRDPPAGPAVLTLRLESRDGALDVVEAEIDSLGTSTRALAICCGQVLKGWPILAPLAAPGKRYRLRYLLN